MLFVIVMPHAGSGVVRIGLLCLLAGCSKRFCSFMSMLARERFLCLFRVYVVSKKKMISASGSDLC